MKTTFKQELLFLCIVAIPFLYLAFLWNSLPASVPTHWDLNGKIDRFGNKFELLLMPIFLPLLSYLIFLFVAMFDKKNQFEKMGTKFYRFKLWFILSMSGLATYFLYMTNTPTASNPNILFAVLGMLFTICGNYFPVLRPNRFLGIRTPWTLKNDIVWQETHKMAGWYWVIGGIAIMLASFLLPDDVMIFVSLVVTSILVIVPIAFSYIKYRNTLAVK